jgi:hypothetical protein
MRRLLVRRPYLVRQILIVRQLEKPGLEYIDRVLDAELLRRHLSIASLPLVLALGLRVRLHLCLALGEDLLVPQGQA